jgi:hypothetical protein
VARWHGVRRRSAPRSEAEVAELVAFLLSL